MLHNINTCHQGDENCNYSDEIQLHTYYNGQILEQHQALKRIQSNKNSHSLLVEMQTGTATLRDSLAISHKCKYTLTI